MSFRAAQSSLSRLAGRLFAVLLIALAFGIDSVSALPYAYIANQFSNSVSVIDTATNAVVTTIPVGSQPRGVAVNPSGAFAYVANRGGNTLSVIDTLNNTVTATIPVGTVPLGVALNAVGTFAYVANNGSNSVSVINTASQTVVASIPVGNTPYGIAVNPAGTFAYVANSAGNTLSVIDTASNTVTATVPVGAQPLGIAVNPAGTRVYVANFTSNTISIIDGATNTVLTTIPISGNPASIAFDPSGATAYVALRSSDSLAIVNTLSNTVTSTVNVGIAPFGVAVNPAGTFAYVANSASNNVSVLDTVSNTVVATIPVGSMPAVFGNFVGGPPTYTVTYNGNSNIGGTVPTDANRYTNGQTVTVLANAGGLVRTGYTFSGWNTAADGSGTTYPANGSATFAMGASNVTLYANWTAIPYSVTYDGNGNTGGAVPVDGNSYTIGQTVTVLGNPGALVKSGYTFAGWNTAANGSGTNYVAGTTFAVGSSSVVLYARWAAPPAQIPTLSDWGKLATIMLVAMSAMLLQRRRLR